MLLSRRTDEIKPTLYAVFSYKTELISRKLQKFQDMRVSRIIAGILAVAMGLSSCVRDVIMDAKEKPKVVVSCILSNDPVHRIVFVLWKKSFRFHRKALRYLICTNETFAPFVFIEECIQ